MLGLAMNNRGHALAGIFAHPFPNAHDIAAGGVDNLAAVIPDLLQNGQLRAEGGEDNYVLRLQFGNVRLFIWTGQVFDSERRDLLVDFRIVNNLANDEEAAIFENLARGVGQIDGTLDSVTKAKLFRKPHCDIAHRNNSAVASHAIDDIAAVM